MSHPSLHQNTLKDQLGHFGRVVALLFNRAMMYQKDHPLIQESISNLQKIADLILQQLSPLVFIMNQGKLFTDDEPLDPRINVVRIVDLFKAVGIQSVSFEKGLTTRELNVFLDLYSKLTKASRVDEIIKSLSARGVFSIKINHVTFKKVTADDQVVSRDTLKKVTPFTDAEDQQNRKKFLDALLESVLSEELSKTLSITNLMKSPASFSQHLIEADLAGVRQLTGATTNDDAGGGFGINDGGAKPVTAAGTGVGLGQGAARNNPDAAFINGDSVGLESGQGYLRDAGLSQDKGLPGSDGAFETASSGDRLAPSEAHLPEDHAQATASPGTAPEAGGAGTLLIHQLDLMQREVERHLHGEEAVNLSDLASAVFDMKKQLLESIQTQKTLGVAYTNEAAIIESADRLSDRVVIELIKEEYASGKITTQRLAMIIRRMIPEARDLKRLLPKIKVALLASGMTGAAYMELVGQLQNELQSEALSRILEESAETIGVDGDALITEFKRNPTQAAELIYLASEIRAGSGDEAALTSILVEYVEQLGGHLAQEGAGDDGEHLQRVVSQIQSGLLGQLAKLNVDGDMLDRMEARINERMEAILDRMRLEWLQNQSEADKREVKLYTVLQTLESNAGDDEELGSILKVIRAKVEAGEVEENDFSQIYREIDLQKQHLKENGAGKKLAAGILDPEEVIFLLKKEIAKSERYQTPFSVLAFACVTAKPKIKTAKDVLSNEMVLAATMQELVQTFRNVDFVGMIGKNKILVILPMTAEAGAKTALSRILKNLNGEPLMVGNVPVQLRVAGVAAAYHKDLASDAQTFASKLSNQLMDMVTRLKNVQALI